MKIKKYGWLALVMASHAHAFCFAEAGQRYQIDPVLLKAIAQQESTMNPRATNHNRDRHGKITSTDFGVMQINSMHIPELIKLGIIQDKKELLDNACLNVQVGAWILAKTFQSCNITWECLGAYNAGFAKNNPRRMVYARKIYDHYRKLKGY